MFKGWKGKKISEIFIGVLASFTPLIAAIFGPNYSIELAAVLFVVGIVIFCAIPFLFQKKQKTGYAER